MKTELEKLKSEIENNYKADIAAVNQLLGIYGNERAQASNTLAGYVAMSRPKKSTSEIIEERIKAYDGVFNTADIYFKLKAEIGKSPTINQARQISQVINKLRQRKPSEIQEVEKGKGSRSGKYKYIKP